MNIEAYNLDALTPDDYDPDQSSRIESISVTDDISLGYW